MKYSFKKRSGIVWNALWNQVGMLLAHVNSEDTSILRILCTERLARREAEARADSLEKDFQVIQTHYCLPGILFPWQFLLQRLKDHRSNTTIIPSSPPARVLAWKISESDMLLMFCRHVGFCLCICFCLSLVFLIYLFQLTSEDLHQLLVQTSRLNANCQCSSAMTRHICASRRHADTAFGTEL